VSDPRPETPDRQERRRARRAALESLAARVRELIDATVSTDVEPEEIEAATADVAAVTARLDARRHTGHYSGLLGRDGIDHSAPHRSVPLSPWIGTFNPIAPPLVLELTDGRVAGRVRLGKPYIGPPATAHGGIVAGIMDQLLATAGQGAGTPGVTGAMTVRFRRPTPLYEELHLAAWAEPRGTASRKRRVHAEIRHGDVVTAEAEAVLVESPRLEKPIENPLA